MEADGARPARGRRLLPGGEKVAPPSPTRKGNEGRRGRAAPHGRTTALPRRGGTARGAAPRPPRAPHLDQRRGPVARTPDAIRRVLRNGEGAGSGHRGAERLRERGASRRVHHSQGRASKNSTSATADPLHTIIGTPASGSAYIRAKPAKAYAFQPTSRAAAARGCRRARPSNTTRPPSADPRPPPTRRGTPPACAHGRGAGACARPWPRSAGRARASP